MSEPSVLQEYDDRMALRAGSPENREAVSAFLEKRDPDFRQFRKPEVEDR